MTIKSKKVWNFIDVRNVCVKNNLFTRGTNEEYEAMFNCVRNWEPTDDAIYQVADCINRHSENQTVSNIMFMLANEAVTTCFTLYDDNGNEIE